jgi:hypothetical protein
MLLHSTLNTTNINMLRINTKTLKDIDSCYDHMLLKKA